MKSQTTHEIYELKVDHSNASRLYEYHLAKNFIKAGDTVLDFGCNAGTGIDVIYNNACHFYGIDVVPGLQQVFREKYRDKPNVHLKIVKEGELFDKTEMFDVVLALNIIEHLDDPHHYLRELKRVTKPGGRIILTTVNRNLRLLPWQKPWNPYHVTEFSPVGLRKLLEKHYSKIELRGIIKGPPFFPDYSGMAMKRKLRLGVELPARQFVQKIKMKVKGKREQVAALQAPEQVKKSTRQGPAIETFDISLFQKAFESIRINENNPSKWSEILAVCQK